jgi:hypothetical protein
MILLRWDCPEQLRGSAILRRAAWLSVNILITLGEVAGLSPHGRISSAKSMPLEFGREDYGVLERA